MSAIRLSSLGERLYLTRKEPRVSSRISRRWRSNSTGHQQLLLGHFFTLCFYILVRMGVFLYFSFLLLLEFPRLRWLHPVENKSVKKKYLTFPWTIFSQWAHNLLFFCMSLICSIVLLWSFFDIIFWHPLELCILFFKDFFPGKTCFQWSDLSFCPLEMMSLILTGFTKRCCGSYVHFYKIVNHNWQGDSCSDLDPRSSPVSVEVVLADNSHHVLWQHLHCILTTATPVIFRLPLFSLMIKSSFQYQYLL